MASFHMLFIVVILILRPRLHVCRIKFIRGQVNNADPADPVDPADLAILVRDIKVRVIQFDLGEIE